MARKKATRKKVTLNYIHNNSTRRASFRKRLKGLMKKATELATMCGVKTCVVVYGEGEAEPKVFPSHDKAVVILNEYKSMPDLGHCKKTMDQEAFLTKRIAKLHDKVDKARHEVPGQRDQVEELLKSLGERMAKIEVQAPPPAPCISTGSIDMGSPSHYLASPQHQDGYLNMVSSGGDVGTQVYGGNASHDGAGFSGGDMMMQM
ncbi:hypothetical protein ZWY2020_023194 [Hordeum vulgare]|nr:hypothetical protein ZWY2020_023194 [Hordeum vulgare]